MRAVIQRVSQANVIVGGETVGQIDIGVLILLGITHDDCEKEALYLSRKIAGLRILKIMRGR